MQGRGGVQPSWKPGAGPSAKLLPGKGEPRGGHAVALQDNLAAIGEHPGQGCGLAPQGCGTGTRPQALHIPALDTQAPPHLEPCALHSTPGSCSQTQASCTPAPVTPHLSISDTSPCRGGIPHPSTSPAHTQHWCKSTPCIGGGGAGRWVQEQPVRSGGGSAMGLP